MLAGVVDHDGEHHLAVVADLPVGFAVLVAVGHEEGAVLAVEAVDADPGGEGEGGEFAGDFDADAGAGSAEFEGGFDVGPAAVDGFGEDDGAVELGVFEDAGVGDGVVGAIEVEGVVGDEAVVLGEGVAVGLPVFEGGAFLRGVARLECCDVGERDGAGGGGGGGAVGRGVEGEALGDELVLLAALLADGDFAVEDFDVATAGGDFEAEFGAEVDYFGGGCLEFEAAGGGWDLHADAAFDAGGLPGGFEGDFGGAFDGHDGAGEELDFGGAGGEAEGFDAHGVAFLEGDAAGGPDGIEEAVDDGEAVGGFFGDLGLVGIRICVGGLIGSVFEDHDGRAEEEGDGGGGGDGCKAGERGDFRVV